MGNGQGHSQQVESVLVTDRSGGRVYRQQAVPATMSRLHNDNHNLNRFSRSTPNITISGQTLNTKNVRVVYLKPVTTADIRQPSQQQRQQFYDVITPRHQPVPAIDDRSQVEHWLKTQDLAAATATAQRNRDRDRDRSDYATSSTSQGYGTMSPSTSSANQHRAQIHHHVNREDVTDWAGPSTSASLRAHTAAMSTSGGQGQGRRIGGESAAYNYGSNTLQPPPQIPQINVVRPDTPSAASRYSPDASSAGDNHFVFRDGASATRDEPEVLHLRWSPTQARRAMQYQAPEHYRNMPHDTVDRGYYQYQDGGVARGVASSWTNQGARSVVSLPLGTLQGNRQMSGSRATLASRRSKAPSSLTVGNKTLGSL